MKREAVGCTKMKDLCGRLKLKQWQAIGILESLWLLTAKETPQGDIGKLSNEMIALGMDYQGNADRLITALTQSRWLDVSEEHRLIVHDWHEHSNDSLDMQLARTGKLYANGKTPRMTRLSKKERGIVCASNGWHGDEKEVRAQNATKSHEMPQKATTVPNHTVPNHTVPEPESAEAENPPVHAKATTAEPDSVDARILSEQVGIFDIRQQEAMLRLMRVHARDAQLTASQCIEHMTGRWETYRSECSGHEWQYGSAYKFFTSGKWDDPRSWPRAGPKGGKAKAEQEWEAFKVETDETERNEADLRGSM